MDWTGRELRWLVDSREQRQGDRIADENRLRAVVQGQDETFQPEGRFVEVERDGEVVRAWLTVDGEPYTPDEVIEGVKEGWTDGPVPVLGRELRRHWKAERELTDVFADVLESHPAWPWLQGVKGVGPALAGKLLSRLDVREAPYPSSFWSYCGLATVPGERYRCAACGLVKGFPEGYNVTGKHKAHRTVDHDVDLLWRTDPGGAQVKVETTLGPGEDEHWADHLAAAMHHAAAGDIRTPDGLAEAVLPTVKRLLRKAKAGEAVTTDLEDADLDGDVVVRKGWREGAQCRERLEQVAGPDDGVRVAQPRAKRGEKRSYDAYAKKVVYQIATSLLKAHGASKAAGGDGSPYGRFYDRERAKAERERPGWADGRKRYLALRKTEKLFLAHLHEVWREAVDLEFPGAYAQEYEKHDGYIDPWEMSETEAPQERAA